MMFKATDNPGERLFEFVLRRLIEARDAESDRVILNGDGNERPKGFVVASGGDD